jgi:hypothetical protein
MNEIQTRNEQLKARLQAARADKGYAVVMMTTRTVHAAVGTTSGWGGHLHPRALCQPHTPRAYAGMLEDQTKAVTCKRCLAGLWSRGIAVAA